MIPVVDVLQCEMLDVLGDTDFRKLVLEGSSNICVTDSAEQNPNVSLVSSMGSVDLAQPSCTVVITGMADSYIWN